ncbi:hypothetical protein QR680_014834 [Steinernema hermaphroditum]|uniref:Uncharacterized protein n=1 Tax=Steinernema hermaphroditum TaxID=289476 RepID=A0AA39IBV4_9BILA|nr:hypothetical protein QR680_014834 [Steinernema hermaphroditum]
MNDLPLDFYEKICVVGCSSRCTDTPHLFKELRHIAGSFGVFAQRMFDSCCYCSFVIRRNSIRMNRVKKYSQHQDIRNLSNLRDFYIAWVTITFEDGDALNVDHDIAERVRYIRSRHRESRWCLQMDSPIISEQWAECLSTWKLHCLTICTELQESSLELCKRIVEKGALTKLLLCYDITDESRDSVELAKSALLQERFTSLYIRSRSPLTEIIDFWRVNAHRLSGKDVLFDGKYQSVTHMYNDFRLCNEEDWIPIEKRYAYFPRTLFDIPSRPRCLNFDGRSNEKEHNMFMFYDSAICDTVTNTIGLLFT